jgi:hypothetical protein
MMARKAEIDRADDLELQFDSNPADDDTSGYVEPTTPAMDATKDAAEEESYAVDTLTTDEATADGPYA